MKKRKLIYSLIFLLGLIILVVFKLTESTLSSESDDTDIGYYDFYDEDITPIYNLTYLGDPKRTSFTTVVTTLFLFEKSKHSKGEYEKWASTMIDSLGVPVVAFVDYNWAKKFIDKCNQNNITGRVYIVNSIWRIMKEFENGRSQKYTFFYKRKQLALDPEKKIHSPELYAVWNLKTYLMKKVSDLNPFKSEFFIYTDSGAWRVKTFKTWPHEEFVKHLASKLHDRILYGQVKDPKSIFAFFKPKNFIQGTFFAGSAQAIAQIYEQFYTLHDKWLNQGRFVGKDQNLMNALAHNSNSSIVRLLTFGLECTSSYNIWFFYQYYFAHPDEYNCENDRLSILVF